MSEPVGPEPNALAATVGPLARPDGSSLDSGTERKWREIDQQVEGKIAGSRALLVGSDVDADASECAARGASYVLACLPQAGDEGSRSTQESESAAVDYRLLSWRELDPERHGTFDLVHCDGLLHRVTEPLALLRTLRTVTAPYGILLIGSIMLDDPERSEYLRFIPDRYAGDATWWFIPGRLAFRWLVQTAGFDVRSEFAEREGPRDLFPLVAGYLKATAR